MLAGNRPLSYGDNPNRGMPRKHAEIANHPPIGPCVLLLSSGYRFSMEPSERCVLVRTTWNWRRKADFVRGPRNRLGKRHVLWSLWFSPTFPRFWGLAGTTKYCSDRTA